MLFRSLKRRFEMGTHLWRRFAAVKAVTKATSRSVDFSISSLTLDSLVRSKSPLKKAPDAELGSGASDSSPRLLSPGAGVGFSFSAPFPSACDAISRRDDAALRLCLLLAGRMGACRHS